MSYPPHAGCPVRTVDYAVEPGEPEAMKIPELTYHLLS